METGTDYGAKEALSEAAAIEEDLLSLVQLECKTPGLEFRLKGYNKNYIVILYNTLVRAIVAQNGVEYFKDASGNYIPTSMEEERKEVLAATIRNQGIEFPPKKERDRETVIEHLCAIFLTLVEMDLAKLMQEQDAWIRELIGYDDMQPEIEGQIPQDPQMPQVQEMPPQPTIQVEMQAQKRSRRRAAPKARKKKPKRSEDQPPLDIEVPKEGADWLRFVAAVEKIESRVSTSAWANLPDNVMKKVHHLISSSVRDVARLARVSKRWKEASTEEMDSAIKEVALDSSLTFACNLPYAVQAYSRFMLETVKRKGTLKMDPHGTPKVPRNLKKTWRNLQKLQKIEFYAGWEEEYDEASPQAVEGWLFSLTLSVKKGPVRVDFPDVGSQYVLHPHPLSEDPILQRATNVELRKAILRQRITVERRKFYYQPMGGKDNILRDLGKPLPTGVYKFLQDREDTSALAEVIKLFVRQYPNGRIACRGMNLIRGAEPKLYHKLGKKIRRGPAKEGRVRESFPFEVMQERRSAYMQPKMDSTYETKEYTYVYLDMLHLVRWIVNNLNEAVRNYWFCGRNFMEEGFLIQEAFRCIDILHPDLGFLTEF